MRDLTLIIPSGIANRKTKSSVSVKTWNLSILAAIIVFGLVYFFLPIQPKFFRLLFYQPDA